MVRNPWFTFNDTTSTGVEDIPIYGNVHIIDDSALADGSGAPKFITVIDTTNFGGTIATIAELLAATAQWLEIGSSEQGGIVYNDANTYEAGDTVSYIDSTLTAPMDTEMRTYTCLAGSTGITGTWDATKWNDLEASSAVTNWAITTAAPILSGPDEVTIGNTPIEITISNYSGTAAYTITVNPAVGTVTRSVDIITFTPTSVGSGAIEITAQEPTEITSDVTSKAITVNAIVVNDFIAYYILENDANDYTATSNGSLQGTAATNGTSLVLDGSAGCTMEASSLGMPIGEDPRSFSFWFRTSTGAANRIFSMGENATGKKLEARLNQTDSFKMRIENSGGGETYTTTALNDSAWHYSALTYKHDGGGVGDFKCYIDDSPDADTATGTQAMDTTDTQFRLGADVDGGNNTAIEIGRFRIYDREITSTEQSMIYNAEKSSYGL